MPEEKKNYDGRTDVFVADMLSGAYRGSGKPSATEVATEVALSRGFTKVKTIEDTIERMVFQFS